MNLKPKCSICGKSDSKIIKHHTCYEPEETIDVCWTCHNKIHRENPQLRSPLGFYYKTDYSNHITTGTKERLSIIATLGRSGAVTLSEPVRAAMRLKEGDLLEINIEKIDPPEPL